MSESLSAETRRQIEALAEKVDPDVARILGACQGTVTKGGMVLLTYPDSDSPHVGIATGIYLNIESLAFLPNSEEMMCARVNGAAALVAQCLASITPDNKDSSEEAQQLGQRLALEALNEALAVEPNNPAFTIQITLIPRTSK